MYCKRTHTRIIIDATGKIVKKITVSGGAKSGNIFRYLGVVRIPGSGDGLIPVVQMLSERHNSNAITYWLSEWIIQEACISSEVVLDDSAALIPATCRALGGNPRTASYINNSLRYLQGNDNLKPQTLIRIDVAYLTNLILKWPEIARMKNRTKDYFIRLVVLLAKAETIDNARDILKAFFCHLSQ